MGLEGIIAAIISGGMALIGVVITNIFSSRRISSEIEHKLEVRQAVTDQKIEDLTREVRKHNNFAERMPALETEVHWIKDKVDYFHSGQ